MNLFNKVKQKKIRNNWNVSIINTKNVHRKKKIIIINRRTFYVKRYENMNSDQKFCSMQNYTYVLSK